MRSLSRADEEPIPQQVSKLRPARLGECRGIMRRRHGRRCHTYQSFAALTVQL